MIKILLGGSPCTYWSIAQKNNRETKPSGIGWELFENYLIAKEKFKPDYFLYENNKSAAQAIKDEIKKRLNVWDGSFLTEDSGARYIEINSALVSAQNRQRFYVHNCGDVEQPKDRGILLRDILESGDDLSQNEKSYCLTSTYDGAVAWNTIERKQRTMVAEPIGTTKDGKAFVLTANYSNGSGEKIGNYAAHTMEKACKTMVAEPVRIPEYSSDKARPLNASYKNKGSGEGSLASDCFPDNPNKQVFDYIAEPVNVTKDGKSQTIKAQYQNTSIVNICCYTSTFGATGVAEPVCVQEQVFGRQANENGEYDRRYEARLDGKSGSLTGTNRQNAIAEPVRIGTYPSEAKNKESKQYRIYDVDGKSTTLCGEGGGMGAKTGLYAIPMYYGAEAVEFDESGKPTKARSYADGKIYTAYEVRDGLITIKGKQYPIKLKDGYYIIRKLTVTECCRLQTLPDDFCRAVSASQGYKGCGNGWTAEVIIHILSHALKNVPKDEKIVVLSMYDGIGTGRYCLDKMGFTNVEYYASEIDKYAMQIAMSNYPDIIQIGDAFQVRDEKWSLEK